MEKGDILFIALLYILALIVWAIPIGSWLGITFVPK
jgi:hypothetical protein